MSDSNKHIEEEQIAKAAEQIVAGERSDIDALTLEHLENCAPCSAELVTVIELLEEARMKQPTPKNKAIPKLYWFGASMAALIILGFFIFTYITDSQTNKTTQIAQQKSDKIEDTATAPVQIKKTKPLNTEAEQPVSIEPDKLQLNEQFESQILEIQSAYRSEDFKLVSPYYLSNTKHQKLQWQSSDEEFLLEWWSIDAEIIKEQTTNNTYIEIPPFKTGVYYFKLLNSDYDLLAVGRLTVE